MHVIFFKINKSVKKSQEFVFVAVFKTRIVNKGAGRVQVASKENRVLNSTKTYLAVFFFTQVW